MDHSVFKRRVLWAERTSWCVKSASIFIPYRTRISLRIRFGIGLQPMQYLGSGEREQLEHVVERGRRV
jgi:hypothetical protein